MSKSLGLFAAFLTTAILTAEVTQAGTCSINLVENQTSLINAVNAKDPNSFRILKHCKGIDLNGLYATVDSLPAPLIVGAVLSHDLDIVADIIGDPAFDVNRTYDQSPFATEDKQIGTQYPLIINLITRNIPYIFGTSPIDQAEVDYERAVMRLVLIRKDIKINEANWSPKTKTVPMAPVTLAILSQNGIVAPLLMNDPRVNLNAKTSQLYDEKMDVVDAALYTKQADVLKLVLAISKINLGNVSTERLDEIIVDSKWVSSIMRVYETLVNDPRYPINSLKSLYVGIQMTDLMYASKVGNEYAVAAILKRADVNVNAVSSENKTALAYATEQRVRDLLVQHGAK